MEEKVRELYNCSFNNFTAEKKYAPVVASILETLKDNKESIPIQSALEILEDSKKILLRTTKV